MFECVNENWAEITLTEHEIGFSFFLLLITLICKNKFMIIDHKKTNKYELVLNRI